MRVLFAEPEKGPPQRWTQVSTSCYAENFSKLKVSSNQRVLPCTPHTSHFPLRRKCLPDSALNCWKWRPMSLLRWAQGPLLFPGHIFKHISSVKEDLRRTQRFDFSLAFPTHLIYSFLSKYYFRSCLISFPGNPCECFLVTKYIASQPLVILNLAIQSINYLRFCFCFFSNESAHWQRASIWNSCQVYFLFF